MQHRRIHHAVLRGQRVDPAKLDAARKMRHAPTPGEVAAWAILRDRRLEGLKFRRQQVIAGFIVDFYCAEFRIVVEVDGDVHHWEGAREAGAARSVALNRLDIQVVRVRSDAVSAASLRSAILPLLGRSAPPLP